MALLGAAVLVAVAVALAALGAGPARAARRARVRGARAAAARLGRALALRPLAGRARRRRARGARPATARLGPGAARLRRSRRSSTPAVLVPLALVVRLAAARAARGARLRPACAAAVVALAFVPFLVARARRRLGQPLAASSRGRCRSRASARGSCSSRTTSSGTGVTMESSHGSQNLAGTTADAVRRRAVGPVSSRRSSRSGSCSRAGPTTASGSSATRRRRVVAFVALGKVLSPQFLIWLVPLVPARARPPRADRRGAARRRARPDPALVPVPLLGLRAPLRRRSTSWLVLARDLVLRRAAGDRSSRQG